jgi:hypothetical protein
MGMCLLAGQLGQLGRKGFWHKPKRRKEASKFDVDNTLNDFG